MTTSKLLRVNEAAELLGLKPHTLRLWLSGRRLPVVRFGRTVRIPLDAIEQLITDATIPAKGRES